MSLPTRPLWQVPGSSTRWPHPHVSPHLIVRGHEVYFSQLLCPLMHKLQEQLQVVFHGEFWTWSLDHSYVPKYGGGAFYSHAGKTSRPLQSLHMYGPRRGSVLFLFIVCLCIYIPSQGIISVCVCLSVSSLPTLDTSFMHFISLQTHKKLEGKKTTLTLKDSVFC